MALLMAGSASSVTGLHVYTAGNRRSDYQFMCRQHGSETDTQYGPNGEPWTSVGLYVPQHKKRQIPDIQRTQKYVVM